MIDTQAGGALGFEQGAGASTKGETTRDVDARWGVCGASMVACDSSF